MTPDQYVEQWRTFVRTDEARAMGAGAWARLEEMFRQCAAEERDGCAGTACEHCAAGHKPAFRSDAACDLGWYHPTVSPGTMPCKAARIRARA